MIDEVMELPDYGKIIKDAIHEMKIKFERYGNNWKTSDAPYWKERLSNEVEEYVKSTSIASEDRKLLNIINIAAMARETINNRGCMKHIVPFDVIASSKDFRVGAKCITCNVDVIVKEGIIYERSELDV